MADNFGRLLRNSRLATLGKPLQGMSRPLNPHPSHQVVTTTPASFHRRDWGLKAPIPEKHRSLYVNVQAMDSPEGLAQYESGSGFYRKLQRFRELGVPLKQGNMHLDYFSARSDKSKTLLGLPQYKLNRLIKRAPSKRQEFKEFIEDKRKDSKSRNTKADMTRFAVEFWNFNPIHAHSVGKSRSSIGLNYSLKGALHNTPEGLRTGKIVPGRVVNGYTRNTVGLGGFVAESSHRRLGVQDSPLAVRNLQQFFVRSAEADSPCNVRIQASNVSSSS